MVNSVVNRIKSYRTGIIIKKYKMILGCVKRVELFLPSNLSTLFATYFSLRVRHIFRFMIARGVKVEKVLRSCG